MFNSGEGEDYMPRFFEQSLTREVWRQARRCFRRNLRESVEIYLNSKYPREYQERPLPRLEFELFNNDCDWVCPTVPGPQSTKEEHMLTAFNVIETVRNEIQAEHNLISHRLTWFVTSQSFLMAAYAVSLNGNHDGADFFRHAVPWLSVVLSILAGISVSCAIDAQWGVIKQQHRILKRMRAELEAEGVAADLTLLDDYAAVTCSARSGGYRIHWLAMIPPLITPAVFAALWAVAYRWSMHVPPVVTLAAWRATLILIGIVTIFILAIAVFRLKWLKEIRDFARSNSS